jgi:hypothetical protein
MPSVPSCPPFPKEIAHVLSRAPSDALLKTDRNGEHVESSREGTLMILLRKGKQESMESDRARDAFCSRDGRRKGGRRWLLSLDHAGGDNTPITRGVPPVLRGPRRV